MKIVNFQLQAVHLLRQGRVVHGSGGIVVPQLGILGRHGHGQFQSGLVASRSRQPDETAEMGLIRRADEIIIQGQALSPIFLGQGQQPAQMGIRAARVAQDAQDAARVPGLGLLIVIADHRPELNAVCLGDPCRFLTRFRRAAATVGGQAFVTQVIPDRINAAELGGIGFETSERSFVPWRQPG